MSLRVPYAIAKCTLNVIVASIRPHSPIRLPLQGNVPTTWIYVSLLCAAEEAHERIGMASARKILANIFILEDNSSCSADDILHEYNRLVTKHNDLRDIENE